MPSKVKFFNDGLSFISIKITMLAVQKNNNKTSVEIKKDETLTPGIIKKLKEQTKEVSCEKEIFLASL